MAAEEDWIRRMLDRGLLTPEQAAGAVQREVDGKRVEEILDSTPATGAAGPETPLLVSCPPCGKVFPAPGIDPARPPACPSCGAPTRVVQLGGRLLLAADPAGAPSGRKFGRYELRRVLGQGGMGVVHEAWDARLGRPVALKMLSAAGQELEATAVERLMREARSVAKLLHPGIVAIHDVGRVDGRHFFTMELVPGGSLEDRLSRSDSWTSFPLRNRLETLSLVADALGYAHSRGIVHRDVKPSNILFGNDDLPKLTDFGLAKEVTQLGKGSLTLTGMVLGTPSYMSPEQASGESREITAASDVFSLGVVLYRATCGRLPFSGAGLESIYRTMYENPLPPTRRGGRVSAALKAVCLRCLEKDPADRYADGGALAADIRRVLDGDSVQARLPRHRKRLAPVRRQPAPSPRRVRAQTEALRLLEYGRPSLERACRALYDPAATDADFSLRVDAARRQFEEAILRAPDLPLAHYLLGLAHDLNGDDQAAEASWREALRLDPEFGPAHYRIGRLLVGQAFVVTIALLGQTSVTREQRIAQSEALNRDALRRFDLSLAAGSGLDDALHRRVAEAMAALTRRDIPELNRICTESLAQFASTEGREDFHWIRGLAETGETARREFDEALRIRPRFALACYSRGLVSRDAGDLKSALEDFRKTVRYQPKLTIGWISLGTCLHVLGAYPEALVAVERAVALNPSCAPAWCNLGAVRWALGDHAAALADFTRSLKLDPQFKMALTNRGKLFLELDRPEEALQDLETASRMGANSAQLMNNLGRARADSDDPAGAHAAYTEAIALDSAYSWAWNNRSIVRILLGNLTGAVEDASEAIRLNPAYPEAFHNRARARLATGEAEAAHQDASEAIRLRPGYANAHLRRGLACLRLDRIKEALTCLDEAVRLSPEDADILAARGEARLHAGLLREALADLDAAVRLFPDSAGALRHRGSVRAALGDRAGAIADHRKVLESTSPGSPDHALALAFLKNAKGPA